MESEKKKRGEDMELRDYQLAQYQAEDLFEGKVEIIRMMVALDPEGDWQQRGAGALNNPRTRTGEDSIERLYSLLDGLNKDGVQSEAFGFLQKRVPRRAQEDARSEA